MISRGLASSERRADFPCSPPLSRFMASESHYNRDRVLSSSFSFRFGYTTPLRAANVCRLVYRHFPLAPFVSFSSDPPSRTFPLLSLFLFFPMPFSYRVKYNRARRIRAASTPVMQQISVNESERGRKRKISVISLRNIMRRNKEASFSIVAPVKTAWFRSSRLFLSLLSFHLSFSLSTIHFTNKFPIPYISFLRITILFLQISFYREKISGDKFHSM